MSQAAMKASTALAGLALGLILSGCTVGPDFHSPAAPAGAGYEKGGVPAATPDSPGQGGGVQHFVQGMDIPGQWWKVFGSTQLDTLIRQAMAGNPDLTAAQAALRQANEQAYAGEGGLFPTIGANVGQNRERIAGATLGNRNLTEQLSLATGALTINYPLDVFGGVRRTVEQLKAQAEYQGFELEATYLTLTSNLVVAVITEASLRDQIAATQDIIRLEEKQLGVLERQFALGGVAEADVLTQKAALANAQALLPPLSRSLAQERNQITALLGRFPNQPPDVQFNLSDLHLPEKLPVSLPSNLVAQRPDVRAAAATLHAASAGIGIATANELPQFTLTGDVGYTAGRFGEMFTPTSLVFDIAGQAAQTLFDGGALLHKKRAAVAAYDQAAAQYRSTVIKAFQNVADTLRALTADADALAADTAAENASRHSLDVATAQYKLGGIGYLTVLNAQRSYLDTRIARVKAEANRYSDTAALFQALGGGWWHRTDIDPADAGSPDRTWLTTLVRPAAVAQH